MKIILPTFWFFSSIQKQLLAYKTKEQPLYQGKKNGPSVA